MVLVDEWDTHHSFYPFETEAAQVGISPVEGAHMETLAFYFPVVGPYEATLALHWGSTVLPLQIEVPRCERVGCRAEGALGAALRARSTPP